MAIRTCPECGHELADRGRYCPFCGCDVRKTPRTTVPQAAPKKAEPGGEPVYSERKSPWPAILLLAAALFVVAAVLGFLYSSKKGGDPRLRYGMSFEEAAVEMTRCGFVPDGDAIENRGTVTLNYASHTLYGEKAYIISLEANSGKGGEVQLMGYYPDSDPGYEHETALLRSLKKHMTNRYGDPVLSQGAYPWYSWQDKDVRIILFDSGDLILAGEQHVR